jgi:hypothetical protein
MTAKEENAMALYEMRTYTPYVGKMAEAQKLYTEPGFPATSMVRDGVFARETARHTARRWVSAPAGFDTLYMTTSAQQPPPRDDTHRPDQETGSRFCRRARWLPLMSAARNGVFSAIS